MEAERRELEFLRTLGSGGFGAVYLANLHGRDRFVRRVAVKVMREGLDATPDLVARQKDEARLLGLLAHDGIVQVLDLAEVDGRPAVVMEYVEGVDLADLIKSTLPRRVPVRVALELVAGTASALDAAYNSISAVTGQPLRVVHRDIKPANILVTVHGRVKVLDFGVAKADFARDGHTTNGGWGTPRFMSPEQWLGELYGAPVDVYALGVTLFDLVADRPWERPPLARTAFEAHVGHQLDGQADVPESVLALIASMTAFEQGDRPTAAQVHESCEALVAEVGGDSLARYARVEVPPLVEARSKSNANKPLPGMVSLGGVSSTNEGGRAAATHELSVQEPSIVATPTTASAGYRPVLVGGAVVVTFGLFALFLALVLAAWKLSAGFDAPTELADEGAVPVPVEVAVAVVPAAADPAPVEPVALAPAEAPVAEAPVEPAPSDKTRNKATDAQAAARDRAAREAAASAVTAEAAAEEARRRTAAAPVAAAPAAPAVVQTYPFDITTDSIGVEVWVDGKNIGRTPIKDTPLSAGSHTVVVGVGTGRSDSHTVTIGPDGATGAKYYPSEAKWRTTR